MQIARAFPLWTWNSSSSCHERANLAALNPNPLAASKHRIGKLKAKGGNNPGYQKKAQPASSNTNGRPIICFGCNKPGHTKA
jgi:hypothetical protein